MGKLWKACFLLEGGRWNLHSGQFSRMREMIISEYRIDYL